MEDSTLKSCREFVDLLGSKEPAPGGGGAAALVGSLAIALGNMAGSLTVDKPKFAEVSGELKDLNSRAKVLSEELLDLVGEDARAFVPLSKAYSIPKDDPDRESKLTEATMIALEPPLQIMEKVAESIDIIEEYSAKVSKLVISDVGCGAMLAKAALYTASLNVFINTKGLSDRENAERINKKTEDMLSLYGQKADDIFERIAQGLR